MSTATTVPFDYDAYLHDMAAGLHVAVLTIGMSGSGKSTWAELSAADAKKQGYPGQLTVSRDEIRDDLSNGAYSRDNNAWDWKREGEVTDYQHNLITNHFDIDYQGGSAGVWIHDTNLNPKFLDSLIAWLGLRVDMIYTKSFADVPYELCCQRVKDRVAAGGRHVPKKVLKDQYKRVNPDYFKDYRLVNIENDLPYGLPMSEDLPNAYIFDIDGTLAIMHDRSPFEESKVGSDYVNEPVLNILDSLFADNFRILVVSGRSDNCKDETEQWLRYNHIDYHELHMRTAQEMEDRVKDVDVKSRILIEEILPRYNVLAVFDDRDQTVAGWRAHGLTCLQVAPGDF